MGTKKNVGNNQPFADFGTMLEVRDIQFFPDGRSIVDTMGGRRFKVLERGVMDGYNTAKVEFLEDEKVPEDQVQELIKVHDETLEQTKSWFLGSSDFVRKGIVDHYGQIPDTEQDYWTLPNGPTWLWWVLNTLPIDPPLKILLLSKTSLKERLEKTTKLLNENSNLLLLFNYVINKGIHFILFLTKHLIMLITKFEEMIEISESEPSKS